MPLGAPRSDANRCRPTELGKSAGGRVGEGTGEMHAPHDEPSRDGVSHSAQEFTSPQQCAAGVQVLLDSLVRLDRQLA